MYAGCLTVLPAVTAVAATDASRLQWRRQGGGRGGKLPPMGGRPKIMYYVCAFIVMELLRITRQIHCKAVEQRATLIHRQYNRDWGTSYSRPPIDPYLTSPLLQNPGGATARLPTPFANVARKSRLSTLHSAVRRDISRRFGPFIHVTGREICSEKNSATVAEESCNSNWSRTGERTSMLHVSYTLSLEH